MGASQDEKISGIAPGKNSSILKSIKLLVKRRSLSNSKPRHFYIDFPFYNLSDRSGNHNYLLC
ncbi:MAG: hypothetical protein F6K23_12175 [Okeania sp. SIO2C9]|uniref:hypothetical protein n=1 Tax=Okeania sp. SIO2C9 TaxID=2607791 RepID=UPI0013BFDC57|nr:hypothetical protein [Okeania sp. SIO2C9]NEQ73737.1 hypothetical protein [Okeania sp. SIO2C9]